MTILHTIHRGSASKADYMVKGDCVIEKFVFIGLLKFVEL
jgi:hypothetical protein